MANIVLTRTIIEPANPSGNPGEAFIVQKDSSGVLTIEYSYDGHSVRLNVPGGSQTETRLLSLLSTIRSRVWV